MLKNILKLAKNNIKNMKFKDWFTKKEDDEKVNRINEEKECSYCSGTGADPEDDERDCPECHGNGEVDDGGAGAWYDDTPKPKTTKKPGEKKEKEEKKFEVGDKLVLTNDKPSSKMPADAYDFLKTYKTFTVISINDKGKINLGCRISKNDNGKGVEKIYMFSTSRFDKEEDVKSGKKPAVSTDAAED